MMSWRFHDRIRVIERCPGMGSLMFFSVLPCCMVAVKAGQQAVGSEQVLHTGLVLEWDILEMGS